MAARPVDPRGPWRVRDRAHEELDDGWPMILSGLKALLETGGAARTTPGADDAGRGRRRARTTPGADDAGRGRRRARSRT